MPYFSHDEETIVAQCTPSGNGAIALLRISGKNACEIATKIGQLSSQKKLTDLPTHTIHYGWIVDHKNNEKIDQVLFFLMRGPKSFTGQDTVEISCHNNPFIIERIIQQAIQAGARLADHGEFTKRAFLNKKIDLVQAEAINELIHAQTQVALKQALGQLEGSLSHWILSIEEALLKALAYTEASFEFIDEEELEFGDQIHQELKNICTTIETLKKTFDHQHIREGIRIALIGRVNVGKSSLFNAIVGKERAIVNATPGTTRDVIEAGLYRDGNYWTLIDTAGLRTTQDCIEQEGIKRTKQEAAKADILLLIYDGSELLSPEENKIYEELIATYQNKLLFVKNKIDLPQQQQNFKTIVSCFEISTKNNLNIVAIEQAIQQKIDEILSTLQAPFLLNQRQFNLLCHVEKAIQDILPLLEKKQIDYEIVSHHLRNALEMLTELSGKTIEAKSLDTIFKNFCIGK